MKGLPIICSVWLLHLFHDSLGYFHTPSYLEFKPPDVSYTFGFSIGYLSKTKSLLVGAPLSNIDGKVYSCSIDDLNRKSTFCKNVGIDIDNYAGNYNRSFSPDQNFCLGATISVAQDYFLTCAPLWTQVLSKNDVYFGAFGTCFISNGMNIERYFGLTEQFFDMPSKYMYTPPPNKDAYGGIGWSSLSDPYNKIILIAKPMLQSSISYIEMDDPYKPAIAVKDIRGLDQYGYIGQSLAVGKFFNNEPILYAISMISLMRLYGAIGFLYYDSSSRTVSVKWRVPKRDAIFIEHERVGSMFGATLHSVDINSDRFEELLVGAPGQNNTADGYEQGAVHFYVGGGKLEKRNEANLCITGIKDGSRFGTSIASSDLDGDNLPEIIISAPYEGTGVLYVVSGEEITSLLKEKRKSMIIQDLKDVQKIVNADFKALGISLLSLVDIDDDGGKALAAGAFNSNKVAIYRSVPFLNVNISAEFDGVDVVKVRDMNVTVKITVSVNYPKKSKVIDGKLFVTTKINGDGAKILAYNNEILMSKNISLYKIDVVISFANEDPGKYKFIAKIESDTENLKRPDFHTSLYKISSHSIKRFAFDFDRLCKDNCVPKLSLTFEWTGRGNEYLLGSTTNENMTLLVLNDGNSTTQSCARIKITGSKFTLPECVLESDAWYRCDLIEINRHATYPVDVQFDLSQMSNRDKELKVEVMLYNTCAAIGNASVTDEKVIKYNLETSEIYLDGIQFDRNVTDIVLENTESDVIDLHEVYTVTNNGAVTWKDLDAIIVLNKQSFIDNYTVTLVDEPRIKNEIKEENVIINTCTFDLNPNSSIKILTTLYILKEKIKDKIKDGQLKVTTNFTLYLKPTNDILKKSLTTAVKYQVDTSFGHNKNLIILVFVLLALFILYVVIIVLRKVGFFKRKEKAKLDALKEDIRRESIAGLEVVENDIPLQDGNEGNASDSLALIEDSL